MKQLLQIGMIVLSFVVLWLDIVTPLGLAVWLFYYVLLVFLSNTANSLTLLIFATFISVLIIIGGFASLSQESSFKFSLENRISAIIVLWILSYTLYKNHIFVSKLQQRTSELINANRDLESFSYSISHDLKNPLTVISGFSRMLQNTASEKLDSDERLSIQKIVSESDRMGFLIADLLRLTRVGNQELKTETVNLSNIAQESFKALVVSYNVENKPYPEFSVQPEMFAEADPGLMRVLFDNLIGNAIKFSSKTENAFIRVGSITQKNEIVFFVKDNGAGFEKKKADRIFEPFTRLHSQRDFPGTGIGLSIVRKIIERHHGRIWVESEVNKETTFYFAIGDRIKK